MKQSEVLLQGEGNAWLERNREKLGRRDLVSELIETYGLKPCNVLEIGCSNGWRLKKLQDRYGCRIAGLDPSACAIAEAKYNGVRAMRGTADQLPFEWREFDLVICGFFLYLADPCDYLKIAAEVDRVLAEGGHLIIHDFFVYHPFKNQYAHDYRLFSHHFDPSRLWMGHPAYQRISPIMFGEEPGEGVTLLQKNIVAAFPLEIET